MDRLNEVLARWAEDASKSIVRYRQNMCDPGQGKSGRDFWDKCSAREEGRMIDFANRIILRSTTTNNQR